VKKERKKKQQKRLKKCKFFWRHVEIAAKNKARAHVDDVPGTSGRYVMLANHRK